MQLLKDLLYKVRIQEVRGNTSLSISGIHIDSRQVESNGVFIAIMGVQTDGHAYISAAINRGAIAIICESLPTELVEGITYIRVLDSSAALGIIANHYYGEPSKKLKLVGVTGTNGKTTIATLLFKLFSQLGNQCGLISTVQNQIGQRIIPSTHTTPDAITLNELLNEMVEAGCSYAFMECSSHAIHQNRIAGLHFQGGIFSNITHDHLDYHKTFDEYIRVKKLFFDGLPAGSFAVSNADDKRGAIMLQNTIATKHYYSLKTTADFKGKMLDNSLMGIQMAVNGIEVHFNLIGEFNAYNLLAVYGAAICLGEDKMQVLTALSLLTGAEGRFDYIVSKQRIVGIVDYAHTPDALENVLATIKKLKRGYEQIITVVGCGGDRDKTKRPIMAQTACNLSDKVIFTSDNPRTEDAATILSDMESGLDSAARRKYLTIADRKEAIKTAVSLAKEDDIILIAGKGHEKYQDIKGVKYPFDDKSVLQESLEILGK